MKNLKFKLEIDVNLEDHVTDCLNSDEANEIALIMRLSEILKNNISWATKRLDKGEKWADFVSQQFPIQISYDVKIKDIG